MYPYKRQAERVSLSLPIQISFGTQITIQGQLKDLSEKSAFVKIKSSIYLAPNDELDFLIRRTPEDENAVSGSARISRVSVGEGIAIYFTKMDDESARRLQELCMSKI